MLFNSSEFILYFLPATAAGFYFLVYLRQWTLAKYWLIAASFYFYGRWNPRDGILLLGLLCINFVIGALLYRHEKFGPRSILAIGVAINLGVLGYFKYGGFVIDNLNIFWPMPIAFAAPVLPLAISFFTFQKIAYLVDKAKGRLGKVNFGDFVLFVSFFPQLIAGPIVHFREVAPQWRDTDWAARIVSSVPTAIIF